VQRILLHCPLPKAWSQIVSNIVGAGLPAWQLVGSCSPSPLKQGWGWKPSIKYTFPAGPARSCVPQDLHFHCIGGNPPLLVV
jgi:hypothetical protein